jgi:hypothetical protein
MATSGKKAARVTDSRKFEPLIRERSGAFTPRKPWLLYAEDSLAPLRRKQNGSITATIHNSLRLQRSRERLV